MQNKIQWVWLPCRPYQLHKEYDEKRLKKQTATRENFNFALKEIKTVRVFGSLILIKYKFSRSYFSVFSLVLVSIEKIYQTLKTGFHHIFQTSQSSSKILRCASCVQLFPRCLEIWSSRVFRVWYITNHQQLFVIHPRLSPLLLLCYPRCFCRFSCCSDLL